MPERNKTLKRLAENLKNPAWVSFIWFGMSAGISLLETPVKFTAPTITREIALDVGRVVFAALNKAEFIALIVLLILVRFSGYARQFILACSALILIMLAQALWLLPELSARTQQILEGIEPGPSIAHGTYSVLQLLKLVLLLYIGFRSMTMRRS
ncbi:MAG: hypothetical protein WD795_05080 [Woeseia sp.]